MNIKDAKGDMDRPEKEIELLKQELEKARQRERELDDTRKAMLYLLEDLNEGNAAVLKSKREIEAIFDGIDSPIFIHDREMRIIRCNAAYRKAAAIPYKDIIGKRYYDVFPRTKGPTEACIKSMEHARAGIATKEVLSAPGGDRIYETRSYAVGAPSGDAGFIHLMEDVTDEKRAEEKERLLLELSRRMAADMDLYYRLGDICSTAVSLGYCAAWIGMFDPEKDCLVTRAFKAAYAVPSDCPGVKDPALCNGPALSAVKSGSRSVLNDILYESMLVPPASLPAGARCSAAAFPIMDGGRSVGALNVCHKEKFFPDNEIDFLDRFAGQISAYVKNALLFKDVKESGERLKREMELNKHLLMISEATARTTDLDRFMEQAVESVKKITTCDTVLSYIWDGESKLLRPAQLAGQKGMDLPLFATEAVDVNEMPFITETFKTGEVTVLKRDTPDPDTGEPVLRFFGRMIKDLTTLVLIPLAGRLDRLGLLVIAYNAANPKSRREMLERERELKRGIAYQISAGLEDAHLYRDSINKTMELSHQLKTIEIMHEMDKRVLSTLQSQEILDIATSMISKIIPCDRATVIIVDNEKKGFTFKAGFGEGFTARGRTVPFRLTTASEILKTHRPQYIADLTAIKKPLLLENSLINEGFRSILRAPVNVKGEVAGVLCLAHRSPSAFLYKDLSAIEGLASHIGIALENARLVGDLEDLFIGTVKALSRSIDTKSPWTMGHSERVTEIAMKIGGHLGVEGKEIRDLQIAGLLHDIGKLATYEDILDKPGRLTEEEIALIRQHPEKGAGILEPIKQLKDIIPAVKYHHESYDGRGYPGGLKGGEIPFFARILTVADTVDAMGSDRPYRKGKPMEAIVEELKRCSGTQFDPQVVEAFLGAISSGGR